MEIAINILMFLLSTAYWIAVFTILYHLTRFGVGVQPKRLAAGFLVGALIIFSSSLVLFLKIDFNTLIP
jgi:hypothetical protein